MRLLSGREKQPGKFILSISILVYRSVVTKRKIERQYAFTPFKTQKGRFDFMRTQCSKWRTHLYDTCIEFFAMERCKTAQCEIDFGCIKYFWFVL